MELDYSRQYDLVVSVVDENSKTIPFVFAKLIDFDLKPNSSFLVEHEFYSDSLDFDMVLKEPIIINSNLQTNGTNASNLNERYSPINVAVPTIEQVNEETVIVRHVARKNKFVCQNLEYVSELRIIYYDLSANEIIINFGSTNTNITGIGIHKFKFILIKNE
jgi:hypothetical protein